MTDTTIITTEPPRVSLTRLHEQAVNAARRHAMAPYGTTLSRQHYRRFLDANTKFINALAHALGGTNVE